MDKSDLELRCFEPKDQEQCRLLFRAGMMENCFPLFKVEVMGYLPYALILLSLVFAIHWSFQDVLVYFLVCVVYSALVYIFIYLANTNYIDGVLNSDLKDIAKFYQDGSCMFVVLLQGKVVGMAGIQHKGNHKPGQAELARMSVSSSIRKRGIASKLLRRLEEFCRENNYSNIILMTTNAQRAAMALYEKYGFKEIRRKSILRHLPFLRHVHYEKQLKY